MFVSEPTNGQQLKRYKVGLHPNLTSAVTEQVFGAVVRRSNPVLLRGFGSRKAA